ncbi:MAG: tetratricopeptide repeat protein [Proteobacteria bacterium]|nr:tetratricopeptide repeat protein [Pseudomonadota bacterium]
MRFFSGLLLICNALLFLQSARLIAQEQKRASLQVTERKREKKNEKAAPQLRRSALFATQVEKKLIKGIDKTTSYLEKTAKSLPQRSPQRLQILERILNLHMEQASYVRSEEERIYDKKWQAWQAAGKKGTEPVMSNSRSMGNWKAVVTESSDILQEYPRSENADQITYNKAVALQYLGKEKDAARIFTQLIQKYPNSAIAGDAYASLGDFYFDRNDFTNAQTNFGKALKYKRSKRYLWSVFKLGWCAYNLGDYSKGLTYWKQLVSLAKSGSPSDSQMREEALRDMVFAFAELKMIDEAIAYYRANNGTAYIGPFLTLLAQILSDQGNYAQAINVLKKFQQLVPNDPEGPTAQKEIVSLYSALGDHKKVWLELERFAQLYSANSDWGKANKKDLVLETQAVIKEQMLYYATLTHQNAIKDDNRELNMQAKEGYLLFLKYHPKAREVAGVKYYLADIEYFLKDYRAAGRYYLEIASLGKDKAIRYKDKSEKGENMHKEVSINMVNAFVKDFEPEFKVLKKRKPDFKEAKPVSARARNYIKACEKYTEMYPEVLVRVKSCDVGTATIFYHLGQKDNAIRYLKNIAVKYPKEKEGQAAVDLLIPIVKDDRKNLLATADSLLKIPEYRNSKVGTDLRNIQRAAEKEDIGHEKDTLKRAQRFEAQALKYPKDPEVDKLWYNAAVDYIKAGAIPKAIEAYLFIVTHFPDKPQAKESLLQVAQIYEKQLEYDKASDYFIEFTKKFPKEKEAPGALSTACSLQIALNTAKALPVCMSFANRYPDNALGFIEQLIIGAERAKRFDQMAEIIKKQYLGRFKLSPNQQIVAYYRMARAGSRDAGAAMAQIKTIFGQNSGAVSGEALRYVGEIAFREADSILPKYLKIPLVGGTVDALSKSLENKAVGLQQVEQTYQRVVGTKDSYWGIAALYQMGFANEHYAEMLANPPAIQGASKDDVLKELAPQIQARRKAAAIWYKTAQDTVSQFRVYNDWSLKVLGGYNRLLGKKIVFDDFVVQPDFLGSEIASSMAAAVKNGK